MSRSLLNFRSGVFSHFLLKGIRFGSTDMAVSVRIYFSNNFLGIRERRYRPGLTITETAMRLHVGTITARNAPDGVIMEMVLPARLSLFICIEKE